MAPDDTYGNYYGSQPSYSTYQTQRAPSTNATGAYAQSRIQQAAPVSEPYSYYSAQAYAPVAPPYNPQDYSYGTAANYGVRATPATQACNASSADLQSLAYASGLHNSGQRATAKLTTSPQTTAATVQQPSVVYDAPRSTYTNASYAAYGQQSNRPKSINSLVEKAQHNSPQQVSRKLSTNPSTHQTTQRSKTSPQASSAYHIPYATQQDPVPIHTPDYGRFLPNITQPPLTASTYQWSEQQSETDTTAVELVAVYDQWPEWRRKREAERAAKALEGHTKAQREQQERAKREEEERKAEDFRRAAKEREAEERRRADEQRRQEERQKAEKATRQEGTRKAEEEKRQQERRKVQGTEQAQAEARQPAQQTHLAKKLIIKTEMSKGVASTPASQPDVKAQMRHLMAQMRELNQQNPQLLAQIWDEEGRMQLGEQTSTPTPQPTQPAPLAQPTTSMRVYSSRPEAQQTAQATAPGLAEQTSAPPASTRPTHVGVRGINHQLARRSRLPSDKPSLEDTMWPPNKKDQVSKAVSEWLNAIPENATKRVTPEEIKGLLDLNPKYTELCEWLESQGIKLERASFAKALFKAVPNINQPTPMNQNKTPCGSKSHVNGDVRPSPVIVDLTKTSSPAPTQANQPHACVTQPSSYPGTRAPSGPAFHSPYGPMQNLQYHSPYFTQAPLSVAAGGETVWQTQPPPQVLVAKMYPSQQDFQPISRAELEREDSQKRATKADAARKRNFNEIVDLTLLSDEDEPTAKRQNADTGVVPSYIPQPGTEHNFRGTTSIPLTIIDEQTRNMEVVQPINRKDALRRSTYDIKTIARDVLLATGKHPEMRPLNAHLNVLKTSFRNLDNTADLSTLRWDLIDPGDPPPDAFKDTVEPDSDEADDEEEEITRTKQAQEQQHGIPTEARRSLSPVPPPKKRSRPRRSEPTLNTPKTERAEAHRPSGSRRDLAGTPTSTEQSTPSMAPHMEGAAPNFSTNGGGYSVFRSQQFGPDGTPLPKKRGRPVGWRKSIHSKEALARTAGLSPQPASSSRLGTSHSFRNISSVVVDSRSPSVSTANRRVTYNVYECNWDGCHAELHNLDTLRKHVFKFHYTKDKNGAVPCCWENCDQNSKSNNLRTGKPNGFKDVEGWKAHVEFTHLGPMSWSLGDGHTGGLSESHDSASETYLSDNRGRKTTPRVKAPNIDIALPKPSVPIPPVRGRPKLKTDEQKARDLQEALVQRKKGVGPGMDRGGVRLANEKRRSGFIDDEDFEEVISDSE